MALSRQEVVNKFDSVPMFGIVTTQNKICGVPDAEGTVKIRFWVDPDEAGSALVAAQAINPEESLQLTVTPMGTAFALLAGWTEAPTEVPFQLHASSAVLRSLAEELGAEPDLDAFPVFACQELSNSRVMPMFLSRQDLRDTWIAAGRPESALPSELTVTQLSNLAAKMTSDGSTNWKTVMIIASAKATTKAQELDAELEKRKAREADPEADPPPLQ